MIPQIEMLKSLNREYKEIISKLKRQNKDYEFK